MTASIRKAVNGVLDGLGFVEELFLGISLLIIIGLIFGNVFSRFVLGNPYAWPDETAKFLHVVAIYVGVAVASRKNAHLKIDLIPQFVPSLKKLYSVILSVGGVAFSIIFAYLAYRFVAFQRMIQDKSWVTAVPIWVIAVFVLCAGILIFIRETQRLIQVLGSLKADSS